MKLDIVGLFITVLIAVAWCRRSSFLVNFKEWSDGQLYTETTANRDFGQVMDFNVGDRATIDVQKDEVEGSDGKKPTCLKIKFPERKIGLLQHSGAHFKVPLVPDSQYELKLKIRFDPNYDWVEGGILPGLCNNECDVEYSNATTDGVIASLGWNERGMLMVTLKQPHQEDKLGLRMNTNYRLNKDEWIPIKMRLSLVPNDQHTATNTGYIQIWAKDSMVWEEKSMKINVDNKKIDKFHFTALYYDLDESRVPPQTSYIRFEDIGVTQF